MQSFRMREEKKSQSVILHAQHAYHVSREQSPTGKLLLRLRHHSHLPWRRLHRLLLIHDWVEHDALLLLDWRADRDLAAARPQLLGGDLGGDDHLAWNECEVTNRVRKNVLSRKTTYLAIFDKKYLITLKNWQCGSISVSSEYREP